METFKIFRGEQALELYTHCIEIDNRTEETDSMLSNGGHETKKMNHGKG